MKQIIISDSTLSRDEGTFSFKESIEIATVKKTKATETARRFDLE